MSTNGKSPADVRRLEMLATIPATPTQVGAILGEFRRMSIRRRDERLSISAALVGLEELGSTWELTMGQAGRLLHILRATHDRAELSRHVEAANQARSDRRKERTTNGFDTMFRLIAGVLGYRLDL